MVESVLRAVEQVPRGRVVSYGDLAGLVGTTARHVGAILRLRGADVTWWRVTNAAGDPPRHLREEVRVLWTEEGIALKPNGLGCRYGEHRVDLVALADAWERATADLRRGAPGHRAEPAGVSRQG